MERTLAIILPDAVGVPHTQRTQVPSEEDDAPEGTMVEVEEVLNPDKGEYIKDLIRLRFTITDERRVRLSKAQARSFLGAGASEEETDFLSSGPVVVLALEGGDYEGMDAQEHFASSFSGRLRRSCDPKWTEPTRNACYGSASKYQAMADLEFFFSEAPDAVGADERMRLGQQRTLAMIKPDAVRAGKTEAIVAQIAAAGFFVLARQEQTLSKEQAEAFYAEHAERVSGTGARCGV